MNSITATVDTQVSSYSSIGSVNALDDVVVNLTVQTNGAETSPWIEPEFQLIGIKSDKNEVRQLEGFTITSLESHTVQFKLKDEMLTCPGMLKLQLIIKDNFRTSTTVFYLHVGRSLEKDIVSHRDVKVLDDLEEYVNKANHNLNVYEQRMDIRDEQFKVLNDEMNVSEANRTYAELNRQQIFDKNESHRSLTFTNQMINQDDVFNEAQAQRLGNFNITQQNMLQEYELTQAKRANEFLAFQEENQKVFAANEELRQHSETQRDTNEEQRKMDETQRSVVEEMRQQKMTEFEKKANQISVDLNEQINRVDKFVTSSEDKLLGQHDKTDYMGNVHKTIKDTMDSNVEFVLDEVNTVHYEGQYITATDTIERQVRSAILSGSTKYRNTETGDILDSFDSTKKLELISAKMPVLKSIGKNLWNGKWYNGYSDGGGGGVLADGMGLYQAFKTDYIKCKEGDKVMITLLDRPSGNNYVYRNLFDRNFNNIGATAIPSKSGDYVIIPSGVEWVAFHIWSETPFAVSTEKLMIETGTTATTYEAHKSNILSLNGEYGSVGSVRDTVNLITGEVIQRTELRAYQTGDELNSEVVTDMKNTRYKLAIPTIKTVDLNYQRVYSYDGVTHYFCSSGSQVHSLIPTLSIDVPTNLPALVSRQRATVEAQNEQIQILEVEYEILIEQNEIQDLNIELNQDAINFILFTPDTMSARNINTEGVNTMAAYLANQILKGKLDYTLVVSRYGEFKEDIDTILISEGKQDLIK